MFGVALHRSHLRMAFKAGLASCVLEGTGCDFLQRIPPEPAILTEGTGYEKVMGENIKTCNGCRQACQTNYLRWKEVVHD
jgi:hypothetical protein